MSNRRNVGHELMERMRQARFPRLHLRTGAQERSGLSIQTVPERSSSAGFESSENLPFTANMDRVMFQRHSNRSSETIRGRRPSVQEVSIISTDTVLTTGPFDYSDSLGYLSFGNSAGRARVEDESNLLTETIRESRRRMSEDSNASIESTLESGPPFNFGLPEQIRYGSSDGRREGFRISQTEQPLFQPENLRPATTTASVFLSSLSTVLVDELPEEDRSCHICREPYLHGIESEQPVRLPCDHIFGEECISRWLSPDEEEPKSTCPLCRTSFFDVIFHNASDSDDEGFDNWDDVDTSGTNDDIGYGASISTRRPITAAEARSQMQNFEQTWSDQMSLMTHTRRNVPRPYPNARSAQEVLRSFQSNSTPSLQEAMMLGEEMGQLFMRLRTAMRLLKFLPIWNAYGPPPQSLRDPESRTYLETALHRLLHIEEVWIWAHQGA